MASFACFAKLKQCCDIEMTLKLFRVKNGIVSLLTYFAVLQVHILIKVTQDRNLFKDYDMTLGAPSTKCIENTLRK